MLIGRSRGIPSSEITPQQVYANRREFLRAAGVALGAAGVGGLVTPASAQSAAPHGRRLPGVVPSPLSTTERMNTWGQLTTYNNFQEYGIDKDAAARFAKPLKPEPWTVTIEGECARPGVWTLDDVMRNMTIEERVYRLRCVEAWSMVVPWNGFPLADFLARCEPTPRAKFVEFTSLADPAQMPGLKIRPATLPWPYTEALRMDEAMHPLTILAVGLYGEALPTVNGAPLRVVVPWKYGFKSAKSIVKVRFVEEQPVTSWQKAVPREYGFYANVNPKVSHPRWSQAREIRLPAVFPGTVTQMFNGYADQVARLYDGMDLGKNF